MNRAAPRLASLRRLFQQKRNAGGHHEVVNPGPNVTFDLMPVPFQPYQKVYGELQAKFNAYLAVSAVMFVSAFSAALYYDLFRYEECFRPPKAYRNRN